MTNRSVNFTSSAITLDQDIHDNINIFDILCSIGQYLFNLWFDSLEKFNANIICNQLFKVTYHQANIKITEL